MEISSYDAKNVLRTYPKLLKSKNISGKDPKEPTSPGQDFLTVSLEAKKRLDAATQPVKKGDRSSDISSKNV